MKEYFIISTVLQFPWWSKLFSQQIKNTDSNILNQNYSTIPVSSFRPILEKNLSLNEFIQIKIVYPIYYLSLGYFQKQSSGVFCEKGVLKNYAKFTGKHMCHSLFFNKVAGLRPFLVNFVKFLRTTFL